MGSPDSSPEKASIGQGGILSRQIKRAAMMANQTWGSYSIPKNTNLRAKTRNDDDKPLQ